jgi:hypothetical protein
LIRSSQVSSFQSNSILKATKTQQYKASQNTSKESAEDLALPSMKMAGGKGDEETFAEKVNHLQSQSTAIASQLAPLSVNGVLDIASMHITLSQALHSNDGDLIESVLNAPSLTDAAINSTVRKLPPVHVVTFLNILVDRFQGRHTRASQLLRWVRALITFHCGYVALTNFLYHFYVMVCVTPLPMWTNQRNTLQYFSLKNNSYLLTVPDLVRKLSSFYHSLESRVDNGKKLLKLQGRLDLVLSQMEMRQSSTFSNCEGTPLVVVDENDEGMDEDAQYEDMAHPSSRDGNTLRLVQRKVSNSTLEALGNEIIGADSMEDPSDGEESDSSMLLIDDSVVHETKGTASESEEDDQCSDEDMSEDES